MNTIPEWNSQPELWLVQQNESARELLNNPLLQKDVWRTMEDLGLTVNQHQKVLTIRFDELKQDWLKLLTKLYILIRAKRNYSAMYLKNDVASLKEFSAFLESKSVYETKDINR